MDTGVVAHGGLNGGRKLDTADVSRFILGLYQELKITISFPDQITKYSHLRLVDKWLLDVRFSRDRNPT